MQRFKLPSKGESLKGSRLAGYSKSTRDESGVASAELLQLLDSIGETNAQRLSRLSGIDRRTFCRWRSGDSEFVRLSDVDRLLTSLGQPRLLDLLTVIPCRNHGRDALIMAIMENLDEDDVVTADKITLADRTEELLCLREMMLSGDPEQMREAHLISKGG